MEEIEFYEGRYSGPEQDALFDLVNDPDTTPEEGSDALATSGAAAKVMKMVAPIEATTTASKAYAVDDLFIQAGALYRVTVAISQGDTFAPGAPGEAGKNCTVTTIEAEFGNIGPTIEPYTSNPAMDGIPSPGSSGQYADGAHVHPTDTSRAAAADVSSTQQISAPTLTSPAAENVAAGKYRVYNNLLYITNAAISSGETAASFESKLDAVPEGGLNDLKSALDHAEYYASGDTINFSGIFAGYRNSNTTIYISVQCGKNFRNVNSYTYSFSSIAVFWPDGTSQDYKNSSVNMFFTENTILIAVPTSSSTVRPVVASVVGAVTIT